MSLRVKLSLLLFLASFLLGIFTLPHYGINWDEPVHFMRGQAFLHFYLTGKKDYGNLPKFQSYFQKDDTIFYHPVDKDKNLIKRRSVYQINGYEFNYWVDVASGSHPSFSGILASLFNYLFFQRLGLVNDIDSYNLYAVFSASLLIAVIFLWVSRVYGLFSGLVAAVSLALYPLFFAEQHFNVKDIPEAAFYSMTLITFYEAIINKSTKWLLLSSILFGLALSTKFNIMFAPLIMLIWLVTYIFFNKLNIRKFFKLLPAVILYPLIVFAVFTFLWPAIWTSPIKGFLDSLFYYKDMGISSYFDSRFISVFNLNTYPFQWIIFTTPLIILFLSFFGIIYVFAKGRTEKNKTSILILFWLLIPIMRVTMPGTSIYGGIRQIMEYIPAMAILAGIGANYIVSLLYYFIVRIKKRIKIIEQLNNRAIQLSLQVLILLSFLPITLKLISVHPNEGVYFNPLIGGLKGAKEKDIPYWGESLGNPYRQGISWINKNAEKNAKLVISYGMGSNIPSVLIRNDIDFSNTYRGINHENEEYVIGLTNKSLYDNVYYSKYLEKFLIPVYEVKVDNIPILKIWQNNKKNTKEHLKNEKLYRGEVDLIKNNNSIDLDLGRELNLRKIKLYYNDQECKKNENEIIVYTSLDKKTWLNPNNDPLGYHILSASVFKKDHTYLYYLTAERARYIKIDFANGQSCLNNTINKEIYALD